jgi:hypothetical protein
MKKVNVVMRRAAASCGDWGFVKSPQLAVQYLVFFGFWRLLPAEARKIVPLPFTHFHLQGHPANDLFSILNIEQKPLFTGCPKSKGRLLAAVLQGGKQEKEARNIGRTKRYPIFKACLCLLYPLSLLRICIISVSEVLFVSPWIREEGAI